MTDGVASADVVRTVDGASRSDREPLLVIEPLEAFLDAAGIGRGPVEARPIGDGHSNVTFLLRRGALKVVLRRPPRGPLPPSAHDVLREARLLGVLRPAGVRAPEVLAVGEDPALIGAPFYVMAFVEGHVLTSTMPPGLDVPEAPERVGAELVDALAELHRTDVDAAGNDGFGRSGSYLERQLARFRLLLEQQATRPLPDLERVADWLADTMPASQATTVVHGDYRLGNTMFTASRRGPRLVAVLDWELAAIGDPLADLGYLTAMWARPGDRDNPMLNLSPVTRLPGFWDRDALARHYASCTGRAIDALPWYQVLALWKSAIFLEGSYKRYLAGTTDDAYFARMSEGVPALARAAVERAAEA